jgi:histidyl-tRNA synthetase
LFKRSVGESTDIVEKEMYSFEDRNGDSVSLRPEGTAGCVRACIQNGLLHNQTQKLFYSGPMFRRERPQKGRQRQFFQIGAEAFGFPGPDIDIEMIFMTSAIWSHLNLSEVVTLNINTIGSLDERNKYIETFTDYIKRYESDLDDDSKKRLTRNPLRILDSKNVKVQEILTDAPILLDHLGETSRAEFNNICNLLKKRGIEFKINPRLVRGLDYYCKTVFEWTTTELGAQDAVCAGGRYDGLVEQLGGKPCAGIGFALGLERIVLLAEQKEVVPEKYTHNSDVFVVCEDNLWSQVIITLENVRAECSDIRITFNCGGGSLKSQLKRADKSKSRVALIFGEREISENTVSIKYLRENREQELIDIKDLTQILGSIFNVGRV